MSVAVAFGRTGNGSGTSVAYSNDGAGEFPLDNETELGLGGRTKVGLDTLELFGRSVVGFGPLFAAFSVYVVVMEVCCEKLASLQYRTADGSVVGVSYWVDGGGATPDETGEKLG